MSAPIRTVEHLLGRVEAGQVQVAGGGAEPPAAGWRPGAQGCVVRWPAHPQDIHVAEVLVVLPDPGHLVPLGLLPPDTAVVVPWAAGDGAALRVYPAQPAVPCPAGRAR